MSNADVVPYNPVLSKRFNAHINVEFLGSNKAVQNIFKLYAYIFKGHD